MSKADLFYRSLWALTKTVDEKTEYMEEVESNDVTVFVMIWISIRPRMTSKPSNPVDR
ncbi:hypothetical protein PsorP6_009157 [Peronosclerospora sorghi]|uniref:Uncharacterized protein n=1 Tax=Peronosclerospora sorghi TaxID=230839 RepID=A0ACC0W1T6_9STRA|nr:hypothetical protein PsorP6_009157 [Peronosclerospora sorghi]